MTARRPVAAEVQELVSLLDKVRKHYSNDTAAAVDLLSVDEIKFDKIEPSGHAAWMMIASTLLNLDEVVSK